jgi:hypothetical protein
MSAIVQLLSTTVKLRVQSSNCHARRTKPEPAQVRDEQHRGGKQARSACEARTSCTMQRHQHMQLKAKQNLQVNYTQPPNISPNTEGLLKISGRRLSFP